MSIAGITFKTHTASEHEILDHLRACDSSFVPPLGDRVDLVGYSNKLFEKAITFEAWSGHTLAGLVAAYFDDGETRTGYITNVSVLPECAGRGIGSELLRKCIDYAMKGNYREIELEVDKGNIRGISLYEKHNFIQTGEKGDDVIMKWRNDGPRCVSRNSRACATPPSRRGRNESHHSCGIEGVHHE